MMNRIENVHPAATAPLQASVAHFVVYRESDISDHNARREKKVV
jgi:hypothetical protein